MSLRVGERGEIPVSDIQCLAHLLTYLRLPGFSFILTASGCDLFSVCGQFLEPCGCREVVTQYPVASVTACSVCVVYGIEWYNVVCVWLVIYNTPQYGNTNS